jgi:hypothetical protein
MTTTDVMLDTNIFDMVLSGAFDVNSLGAITIFATHVQHDEIAAIPDLLKRKKLQLVFQRTVQNIVPTNMAVWDVSRFDQSSYGTDTQNALFEKMRSELVAKDKKSKNQAKNQARDILIAVTAIANDFAFYTSDYALSEVVNLNGGHALWLKRS